MKKCPKCKAEIQENARFCLYCMTAFEEKQTIEIEKENNKRWLYVIAALLVFALIFIGVFLFNLNENKSDNSKENSNLLSADNGSYSSVDSSAVISSEEQNESSHIVSGQTPNSSNNDKSSAKNSSNNIIAPSNNSSSLNVSGSYIPDKKGDDKSSGSATASSNSSNKSSSAVRSDNDSSSGRGQENESKEVSGSQAQNSSKKENSASEKSSAKSSSKNSSLKSDISSDNLSSNRSSSGSASGNSEKENSGSSTDSQLPSETVTVTYIYREAKYGDDFYVGANLENSVVITGVETASANGEYEIPDTIDGKKVIAIMGLAFCDEKISGGVKKVVIPSTVKTIWNHAFANCYNLTDVYFRGNSVYTEINAFPETAKRNGTLTIYCSANCSDRNYRYYKNSASYYDAEYEEWNG